MDGIDNARILVVEDNYLLADALVECLQDLGAQVVGACASVKTALEELDSTTTIDLVALDVKLDREVSTPVAARARALGIPVLLMTGYDEACLPDEMRGLPRCAKPFTAGSLLAALRSLGDGLAPQARIESAGAQP